MKASSPRMTGMVSGFGGFGVLRGDAAGVLRRFYLVCPRCAKLLIGFFLVFATCFLVFLRFSLVVS